MNKEPIEAWQFLEDLAEKSLQWKIIREPDKHTPSRGSVYQVQPSLAEETKFAFLIRKIEVLELKEHTQVNQVATTTCNGCNATDHMMEGCPFLMGSVKNEVAQVNAAYQRPINDPYAPTYNPGWRNHPNFSWSQGSNSIRPAFTQPNPRPT